MKVLFILLFLVSFAISGCMFSGGDDLKETISDTFYSDLGGFGKARIPLVKPYELKLQRKIPIVHTHLYMIRV